MCVSVCKLCAHRYVQKSFLLVYKTSTCDVAADDVRMFVATTTTTMPTSIAAAAKCFSRHIVH